MVRNSRDWIDVSTPVRDGMLHYPGDPEVRVTRLQSMAEGDAINLTSLSMSVHAGTHIDAPLHFIDGGLSIDGMPVDAVNGPARVIGIADRTSIEVAELEAYAVAAGEILLFKTRNSALWRDNSFHEDHVYLATATAAYLARQGVRAVGIDYLSIGGSSKNESEAHTILLQASIWIIESLDLSSVEPGAYELMCLPLLIQEAEAAPARAFLRPREGSPPSP